MVATIALAPQGVSHRGERNTAGVKRAPRQRSVRPAEAHFQRIASANPDFAGYWYDRDGNLVFNVRTATPRLSRIADSIWTADEKRFAGRARGRVTLKTVRHSFNQLANWRERALDHVFKVDGVRLLDLDERRNVIAIGIEDQYFQRDSGIVHALARRIGIPLPALRIHWTAPIYTSMSVEEPPSAAKSLSHTLQDYERPLKAGYRTLWQDYGGTWYGCTMGWINVDDQMQAGVMLTNAHCSKSPATLDTTVYHQGGYGIATEVAVPHLYECGGDDCHYGDITLTLLTGTGLNADTNGIGRPNFQNESIVIDHTQPKFELIEEYAYSTIGYVTWKVGSETGVTVGNIEDTCVDWDQGEVIKLCLDKSSYYNDYGDSGAPVFYVLSGIESTGKFYGIHSGRTYSIFCPCWMGYYTPLSVIYSEFPDLRPLPQ